MRLVRKSVSKERNESLEFRAEGNIGKISGKFGASTFMPFNIW